MKIDLSRECYSGSHIKELLLVSLPVFLVWVIGFPLFILRLLVKYKHKLNDTDHIIKFGIFYIGLTD